MSPVDIPDFWKKMSLWKYFIQTEILILGNFSGMSWCPVSCNVMSMSSSPFSKCCLCAQDSAWYPERHRKDEKNNHLRLCWWRNTTGDSQHSSDTTSLHLNRARRKLLGIRKTEKLSSRGDEASLNLSICYSWQFSVKTSVKLACISLPNFSSEGAWADFSKSSSFMELGPALCPDN